MALKVLFSPVDSEATGCQRLIYPLIALKEKYGIEYQIINSFDAKAQIKQADVVWLQCIIGPQQRQFLDYCRDRGVPVVIDYDDYFAGVPENIRSRLGMTADEITDNWRYYLSAADVITVPCATLAREIQYLTSKPVKILPNLITREIYSSLADYDPFDDTSEIRILYSCSESHLEDFHFISTILGWAGWLYPQIRILTNGNLNFTYYNPSYKGKASHISRVSYGSYFSSLKAYKPHLFLAPLLDSTYNRCRSDLKYQQAAALKCAFVGSNLATYASVRDGVTGLLSSNFSVDWLLNLRRLIKDPIFARKLGQNAHQELANNLLEDHIHLWYEVLTNVK